jgi:hypothetical protein
MKRLRDELADMQREAIQKALGIQDDATTPKPPGQPVAPSHRRELTQREKEERARKTRARAATPQRPLTHAERVAFHEEQIAQEHAEMGKSNAARLRKYLIDADAVLRTADLLCKTSEDGTQSVKPEQVALATGLPVEFCDKVIETKWVVTGAPPVVVCEDA